MNLTPAQLDRVFGALASPARRRILDLLQSAPGMTIAQVTRAQARPRMSAVAMLKHVRVLERAKLVISERHGRVRRLYFNAVPIQLIYDRWTDQYTGFWAARMVDIKERLENRAQRAAAIAPEERTARHA